MKKVIYGLTTEHFVLLRIFVEHEGKSIPATALKATVFGITKPMQLENAISILRSKGTAIIHHSVKDDTYTFHGAYWRVIRIAKSFNYDQSILQSNFNPGVNYAS